MEQATDCKTTPAGTCQATLGCKLTGSTSDGTCGWCPPGEYKDSGNDCKAECKTPSGKAVGPGRRNCIANGQCPPNSKLGTSGDNEKQCFCEDGFGTKSNGTECEKCKNGYIHKQTLNEQDTVVCVTCQGNTPVANLLQNACQNEESCTGQNGANNAEVLGTDNKQCYCIAGWGITNNSCKKCNDGSISPQGSNECEDCSGKSGTTSANLTQTSCVADTDCGENTESKSNQCVCKDGYKLNPEKTACVSSSDPGNPSNPSTASAATVVAIVMALLAVVVAAATAAAVTVKARKARSTEAEALTAENM